MRSDFVEQAELEWKFQRARDRFNTIRKHFHKLLPQLTGFTSPQMTASVERFFELRIKGPLCESRADMLESFEALQLLKQRRQTAQSLAIARDVNRITEAERSATEGPVKGTQQGTLFGPGAPSVEAAPCRIDADEDAAIIPGMDPLLDGSDDDDWEVSDDNEDVLTELDASFVEDDENDADAFEQGDGPTEPAGEVPLRRATLRQLVEDLLTMQTDASALRSRKDPENGIDGFAGSFAGEGSDEPCKPSWQGPSLARCDAETDSTDEARRVDFNASERPPVHPVGSGWGPGLIEQLLAALASVLTAMAMDGRIVKVTPRLPTASSVALVP